MKMTIGFALALVAAFAALNSLSNLQLLGSWQEFGTGYGFTDITTFSLLMTAEAIFALALLYIAGKVLSSKEKGFAFEASPKVLLFFASGFLAFAAIVLLNILQELAEFGGYYWSWEGFAFTAVLFGIFLDFAVGANSAYWKASKWPAIAFNFEMKPAGMKKAVERRGRKR
ncbi:MAG: hypothetical protein V1708_02075 [Candidatus Micrarchaeota archaeon]